MRVVAKIGTASITDDRGRIDHGAIERLADETASLRAAGHEVLIVSSGAVAAGVAALGLDQRPSDMQTVQAVSAIGQSRLVEAYNIEFARHGVIGAQLLVDPYDFVERRQYVHLRATMHRLLELGVVPVMNENDAIANDELRYGDNDRIAALIANSVGADVLVLLTDMDGVFTADPRRDSSATLIPFVGADDPLLSITADGGGSGRGSGGMASKLTAARMASWSGIRSVIARASRPGVLSGSVSDELVGTTFAPHERVLSARKLWIAFAAEVSGVVRVDDGARRALTDRPNSLLPAGVVATEGLFDTRQVVEVSGPDGAVFARGIASTRSHDLAPVLGRHTSALPDGMAHTVIHRDDLVILA
ncbi:glutamate 5-kinase [Ilumatobacter nonamiensis]|uniref:glutamate 5-kinase n=1 Tax=Ilumatobacter nonamiensis TaxID=467093 RepID=UPI0003469FDE|nr:glutamate 5-kinase [Ilumatobacter nonamiensis]